MSASEQPAEGPSNPVDPDSAEEAYSPNLSHIPSPASIIDSLRVATPKKRNRSWEKKNRPVTFRGVPPRLQEGVKEVAEELQVNVDDVARAFLEFGLQCHRFGEIRLSPYPKGQHMTLFPRSVSGQPGWTQRILDSQQQSEPSKGKIKKGNKERLWQKRVSYRIPIDLHLSIKEIAEKRYVPIGEVVILFIGHALEAYQNGRLGLNPQLRKPVTLSTNLDNETT